MKIPTFLSKLRRLVDDPATDKYIGWDASGTTFHVYNSSGLAKYCLPNYFKHNNFSSFVRQLNMYGFRKTNRYDTAVKADIQKGVTSDVEFENPHFIRGNPDAMVHIQRRHTYTPVNVLQTNYMAQPDSTNHFPFTTALPDCSNLLASTPLLSLENGLSQECDELPISTLSQDPTRLFPKIYEVLRQVWQQQIATQDRVSQLEKEKAKLRTEVNTLRQRLDSQVNFTKTLMRFSRQLLQSAGNPADPTSLNDAGDDISELTWNSQQGSLDGNAQDGDFTYTPSGKRNHNLLALLPAPPPSGTSTSESRRISPKTEFQFTQPIEPIGFKRVHSNSTNNFIGQDNGKRGRLLLEDGDSGPNYLQSRQAYFVDSPSSSASGPTLPNLNQSLATPPTLECSPSLNSIDFDALLNPPLVEEAPEDDLAAPNLQPEWTTGTSNEVDPLFHSLSASSHRDAGAQDLLSGNNLLYGNMSDFVDSDLNCLDAELDGIHSLLRDASFPGAAAADQLSPVDFDISDVASWLDAAPVPDGTKDPNKIVGECESALTLVRRQSTPSRNEIIPFTKEQSMSNPSHVYSGSSKTIFSPSLSETAPRVHQLLTAPKISSSSQLPVQSTSSLPPSTGMKTARVISSNGNHGKSANNLTGLQIPLLPRSQITNNMRMRLVPAVTLTPSTSTTATYSTLPVTVTSSLTKSGTFPLHPHVK